ncbi:tRNA pseudouridine(13) synthase TruD [Alteromonas lipolytica]|uniref:tRNA pseudouridine synthase D n=1 Tax=Alteromonas lipolytica TaxID=1856405 RepID=A0A1E8FEZ3_9ALTE|nr:tRNA pseudouridine(13) synthase TruD [Alteromonas lipolytica]OFI34517.1 tRNA pseudouridine(13) synthase TruD [Alteromonas lipolytica]GGF85180.1 tRNA pseudouridine synthase D [Alteromonas lipolytica]
MQLTTDHWQYLHNPPVATGILKQHAADFRVTEELGYTLTGEGEHIFVEIEKTNLNTAFVAEALARFCQLPLRQVTYAGRKDKYAVTRQWFGIHVPGKSDYPWQEFALEGAAVLQTKRHNKKLRTGQLKGNLFEITLREVSNPDAVISKLEQAAITGVPNYYGSQRFGIQRIQENGEINRGGNLVMAERMLNGEVIKNRNKRSMALSALRSWLFNEMLSERIEQKRLFTILPGDVINLTGSNSIFVADDDVAALSSRLARQDLSTTIPLWGKGETGSTGQANQLEMALAADYAPVKTFLAGQKLTMERRAAIIWPQQLECHQQGDTLIVRFFLPSGCFATTVLRECLNTTELA